MSRLGPRTLDATFRREGRNVVDDLLIGVASACAVYSGGQAVGSTRVAVVGLLAVLGGTVVSSLLARLLAGRWIARADGVLYLLVGLGAFFGARYLNLVFPEDTFPRELQPSSWLIWMLMFGSFVLWRDASLLFQAIPALALFGFVGCYDTFRPVVFFFFVYLICVATLFARTHARDMADRAERSGYFGADLPNLRATGTVSAELRRGPWRWVAGPEWALGSAFAIVVLSLVGAPAVRQGVKPISGAAKLNVTTPRRSSAGAVAGAAATPQRTTRIAQGPVRLKNTPAFDVTAPETYFRTDGFSTYLGGSWTKDWGWRAADGTGGEPYPRRRAIHYRLGDEPQGRVYIDRNSGRAEGLPPAGNDARTMTVTAREPTSLVPVPGELLEISAPVQNQRDPGGGVSLREVRAYDRLPVVYSPTPRQDPNARSGALPASATEGLADPALNLGGAPPTVLEFARRAAGDGPDGLRAERLRRAIASRVAYNINAEAPPPGADPVENALFTTKQGYCDVFASAMVLGARTLGIPARYATGYLGDERDRSSDGTLVLLDSDRHAWAELYFAGRGWVPYDAVAGARVVPGGDRRAADRDAGWFRLPSVAAVANILIGVLVVAGAVLLLWPRRRGAPADLKAQGEVVARYVRTLERATRRTRRRDETLGEYVAASDLGPAAPEANALARDLETLLYAPFDAAGASPDVAALEKRVHSLARELKRLPRPPR